MKKKRFKSLSFVLGLSFMLCGCVEQSEATPSTPQTQITNEDQLEYYGDLLANAQTIEVTEEIFSLNPEYDIEINGQEFGEVEGKYINVTGDVFTLEDESGNVWAKEKQIKRWGVKLNRLAQVMNPDGETVGFISEEKIEDFFKYGCSFHFYDENKSEIAHSDEVFFSLERQYKIKDNNGNLLYTIEEDLFSFSNTYMIEVIDSSIVPVEQAIFLTCILDAISTSES